MRDYLQHVIITGGIVLTILSSIITTLIVTEDPLALMGLLTLLLLPAAPQQLVLPPEMVDAYGAQEVEEMEDYGESSIGFTSKLKADK